MGLFSAPGFPSDPVPTSLHKRMYCGDRFLCELPHILAKILNSVTPTHGSSRALNWCYGAKGGGMF